MSRETMWSSLVIAVLVVSLVPGPWPDREARAAPATAADADQQPRFGSSNIGAATAGAAEADQQPVVGPIHDGPPQPDPSIAPQGAPFQTRAVFPVNSTSDITDVAPGNNVCETAAGNGVCTLRAAIMEANALGGDHTINLPNGIYTLTLPGFEDLGFSDDLDVRSSITLIGQDAANTIVDGGGQFRVFDVRPNVTAALANLTIRNGSLVDNQGAGLRNQAMTTMQNVRVLNNRATSGATVQGNGAGVENIQGGTLTMTDCLVSGNQSIAAGSVGAFGGGIANFGINGSPNAVTSHVTLINTVVETNSASSSGGGITVNQQGARLTTQNSTIQGNTAGNSGGGLAMGGNGASTLIVESSTLRNNTANASVGGAINAFLGSTSTGSVTITINRGTLDDNRAATSSGGIAFGGPNSTLTITNSTLSNNRANNGNGGAPAMGGTTAGVNPGQASITNTTISGNVATGGGGGIASSLLVTLLNSTVTNNSANSTGGGVSVRNDVMTLKNSIIAGNTSAGNANCGGTVISQGANLESAATCTLNAPSDFLNTNPLLGALAANGGPTLTHALLPGSVAVDAGTNAGCPSTDQRGEGRPFDGNSDATATCDIGAFELRTPFQVVCSPRPRIAVQTVNNRDGRLRVTFTTSNANNAIQRIQVTLNNNGVLNPAAPLLGTWQTEFFISRQTLNVPSTVSFTITDACGDWKTFVGGGATAF